MRSSCIDEEPFGSGILSFVKTDYGVCVRTLGLKRSLALRVGGAVAAEGGRKATSSRGPSPGRRIIAGIASRPTIDAEWSHRIFQSQIRNELLDESIALRHMKASLAMPYSW